MTGSADPHSYDNRQNEAGSGRWAGRAGEPVQNEGGKDAGSGEVWSRYHCPVCGHQDRVTVTAPVARISCSHCDTFLEVRFSAALSETASVRVAIDLPES